jgi:hypothetical protein
MSRHFIKFGSLIWALCRDEIPNYSLYLYIILTQMQRVRHRGTPKGGCRAAAPPPQLPKTDI